LGSGLSHQITFGNAFVVRVDGARRPVAGYAALLLAVAAVVLSLTGGVALYGLAAPLNLTPLAARALLYVCVEGPLYAVAAGMLAYEHRARVRANCPAPMQLAIGLLLGLAGFALAVGVSVLLGAIGPGTGPAFTPAQRFSGMALGLVLVAFQAMGEEYFFRGWLQPILAARWGPIVGVAATSVLFAAAHGLFRPIAPLALFNDTLAGLAFGLIAFRSGGLAAPFAAHFAWNWAEQSLAGLTPNPGVDVLGSLFNLDLVGPPLLSGGADELNGTLAALFALLAMVAAALAWRPRPIPSEA
jgi:membrane protease YdiL (CAAX protease family)